MTRHANAVGRALSDDRTRHVLLCPEGTNPHTFFSRGVDADGPTEAHSSARKVDGDRASAAQEMPVLRGD